jgi:glycosyltransferase involved in cell wall biosynthesis
VITVIIPTYNQAECLAQCLEALAPHVAERSDVEVIVADDGSTDGTQALLQGWAERLPNLKALRQENRGPSAARNLGIRNARGEICVFLDCDCMPQPGWLAALCLPFADADVVGVEGRTLPAGTKATPLNHYVENRTGGLYWTCNMAYRTRDLREIGGFDERFRVPGGEDIDIAFRMKNRGQLVFEPNALVEHLILKRSLRKQLLGGRSFSSLILLWRKHPGSLLPAESRFRELVIFHLKHTLFPMYHQRGWLWRNPGVYATYCFIRIGVAIDTLLRLPIYRREATAPLSVREPLT